MSRVGLGMALVWSAAFMTYELFCVVLEPDMFVAVHVLAFGVHSYLVARYVTRLGSEDN